MSQPYKYFAFISYSRKDGKAAAWLQKRLEWFRFPVKFVPEDQRPPDPRYVRPIYRDRTNLPVTDEHYWKNIRLALDQSRFLIVITSPNSATSEPVEMEVAHFLKNHQQRGSMVVPIILSGSATGTGGDGAFCPSLRALGASLIARNLPKMSPDEGADEQDAWEQGFIELVSYLLRLDRSVVGDHIQSETRKQARVLRHWLVAVSALALLVIVGAVLAWDQKKKADANAFLARQNEEVAKAQKRRADEEAAVSKAVNYFLQNDVLRQAGSKAQADRGNDPDPNLTVRVALERAAERIGNRLKDRPLIEAAIRQAIGYACREVGDYHNAGKFDQALPLYEKALILSKAKRGAEHTETLTLMNNLAAVYLDVGKLDQSLLLYEETFQLRKAKLGPEHPNTVLTKAGLGMAYARAKRYSDAEPLLNEAYAGLNRRNDRLAPLPRNWIRTSIRELVELYIAIGKSEQAAQWKQKLAEFDQAVSSRKPAKPTTVPKTK